MSWCGAMLSLEYTPSFRYIPWVPDGVPCWDLLTYDTGPLFKASPLSFKGEAPQGARSFSLINLERMVKIGHSLQAMGPMFFP